MIKITSSKTDTHNIFMISSLFAENGKVRTLNISSGTCGDFFSTFDVMIKTSFWSSEMCCSGSSQWISAKNHILFSNRLKQKKVEEYFAFLHLEWDSVTTNSVITSDLFPFFQSQINYFYINQPGYKFYKNRFACPLGQDKFVFITKFDYN